MSNYPNESCRTFNEDEIRQFRNEKLSKLRDELKEFGRVDICAINNDTNIEVKISQFENKGDKPFVCGRKILEAFPQFPINEKFEVDDGLFHIILKKP